MLGRLEALDEVLRRADYLAVTLSLNDATRGLLGARELGLMKVRGASAPDEISARDRLRCVPRRVGARTRQPGRGTWTDRAWPRLRPDRPRSGVDGGLSRLCGLPADPPRVAAGAAAAAALLDGRRAGHARLQPLVGDRRDPARNLRGSALRHDLRHADAGRNHRRRRGAVGRGRAARRHRQLRAGVQLCPRGLSVLGGGDLARRATQGARRRRNGSNTFRPRARTRAFATAPSARGRRRPAAWSP